MPKSVPAALMVLAFALAAPSRAPAWGVAGHQVVAELASRELEPAARDAVRELLGSSMAAASTWADEIRRRRPQTGPWHFVNIPLEAAAYDAQRDCPGGQCVVVALERQLELLRDPGRSRAARAEALRWVIHLVGDLHQPLHCANDGDRGGNAVEVRWFKRKSNLHRVWDSDVIAQAGLSTSQLVAALRARAPAESRPVAHRSSTPWDSAQIRAQLIAWTDESHALARTAYAVPADHRLGTAYYANAAPAVERQLVRAGQRLASLLNQALAAPIGAQRGANTTGQTSPQAPPASATSAACVAAERCCRICSTGQACGASCISRAYTCHTEAGCACDATSICQ